MSGDNNSDFGGEMKRGTAWAIPLELLAVILALGAGAYLYLTSQPIDMTGSTPSPTSARERIDVSVDGYALSIPANLMPLGRNRAGGDQEDLRLRALLPDMRGWNATDAAAFANTGPESQVVRIGIDLTKDRKTEKERFEKVFLPYAANEAGEAGPYGLTKYALTEGQGYDGIELYTFSGPDGALIVLQCQTEADAAASADCWRTIKPEGKPTVAVTYRFKRAHLEKWRDIDAGVQRLFGEFRGGAKPAS